MHGLRTLCSSALTSRHAIDAGALVSVSGERRNFCLAKVAKYFPNPVKKSGIGETLFAKEVLAKPFPRKSKKLRV